MQHDAIVIGGSFAGMAAALQLGRARRSVLVLDTGQPRNQVAARSHGFLTQDGASPGAMLAQARAQLLRYPTVTLVEDAAVAASGEAGAFAVSGASGTVYEARYLVLAMGVTDTLPDLPGLSERWGSSVFQCPYCDGYELGGKRLGVLASGPLWFHQAMLIPEWGPTTLFVHDVARPDARESAALAARGVTVERARVRAIGGAGATMVLEDGREIALEALFLEPRTRPTTRLAGQLGCAMEEGATGPFIRIDGRKETSVPGVFACGDAAHAAASVSLAVGSGATAGVALHQSLVFG